MTDHANELRRYSRKIGHPAGDVPSVMLAAADEIERLAAKLEAAEKSDAESIAMYRKARDERDALRAKVETAECAWKESDKACRDLTEKVIPNIREQLESAAKEIRRLKQTVEAQQLAYREMVKEYQAAANKIAAMEQQEPIEWQRRMRPVWNDGTWTQWSKCSEESAKDIAKTRFLHDWQYEARALYALPGAKGEEK